MEYLTKQRTLSPYFFAMTGWLMLGTIVELNIESFLWRLSLQAISYLFITAGLSAAEKKGRESNSPP